MQGAYARIVKTCRYGLGFYYLSVGCLHHQCACTVYYALGACLYCCSGLVGVDSQSGRFGSYKFYIGIVDEMLEGTCGIAASAYACYYVIGIFATYV